MCLCLCTASCISGGETAGGRMNVCVHLAATWLLRPQIGSREVTSYVHSHTLLILQDGNILENNPKIFMRHQK